MNNKKTAKIVLSALVGVIILYTLTYIIYQFKYTSGIGYVIANILPVFMIGGVFSLIMLLSAFGGWGKFLRKVGRSGEAKKYEAAVDESEKAYERVKTKYVKKDEKPKLSAEEKRQMRKSDRAATRAANYLEYEVRRETKNVLDKKNILIGFIIMAICGGVAGGVFALNATQNKKFENPNTVAATATVIPVHVRGTEDKYVLRYVYEDEDGNKYVFDPEFGTLNTLRENKTMTVYYNRYNPEHAFAKPKVTFLSVLATFFAAAGVLMFFANIFSTSSIVMPIIAGSVFLTFGGGFLAAIAGAAGLTFLEVIMSGPIQYGCTLFASLGAIFVCAGIYSLFREIYYFFKYLKKKHGN